MSTSPTAVFESLHMFVKSASHPHRRAILRPA